MDGAGDVRDVHAFNSRARDAWCRPEVAESRPPLDARGVPTRASRVFPSPGRTRSAVGGSAERVETSTRETRRRHHRGVHASGERENRGGAHGPRAYAPRRRRRRRSDRRRVRGRGRAPGVGRVGEGAPHPRRSVEGDTTRSRADRESRIADRGSRIADRASRHAFARHLARVMRATRRRRAPAFGTRDRPAPASGRGTSLARKTMWPARDGRWLSYTFRETEDDVRLSARSLRSTPSGGHHGGGVPTRPVPSPGRAWRRVGDAAGGPREGHFGGTGGSGGGECRITIARRALTALQTRAIDLEG